MRGELVRTELVQQFVTVARQGHLVDLDRAAVAVVGDTPHHQDRDACPELKGRPACHRGYHGEESGARWLDGEGDDFLSELHT